MIPRAGTVFAALIAIAAPAGRGASAQDPPPQGRIVTLEDAARSAEQSPDVIIARASLHSAEADVGAQRRPAEPALTLATKSVTARESVALSMPFRWAGQRSYAVSVAERLRDAAKISVETARLEARRIAVTAWYRLAAAEDLRRAAEDQVVRSERNRKAVADMMELQRASKLDAARASVDAASAVASRAEADNELAAASAELALLLGVDGERLTAGDERPSPSAVPPLAVFADRARSWSPEVAAAQSELAAAESRIVQRQRERLPATALQAGADWNDPTQPGTDVTVGLGITFPTRAAPALESARADKERAAARLDQVTRRTQADVAIAWSSAETALARFEAADGTARPAALETAELTRLGYTDGRIDLFHLLDAERVLGDAERSRAEAYRDWGAAYASLERLAPKEHP